MASRLRSSALLLTPLAPLALLALLAPPIQAQTASAQATRDIEAPAETRRLGTEITIYSGGFGLVKDRRQLDLPKGRSSIDWTEVAATIDPSSASYGSEKSYALEQNYRYDLVGRAALLQKYLGREVALVVDPTDERPGMTISGTILSVEGDRITALRSEGKVLLDPPGRVVLPKLPEGLLVHPTLVVDVVSPAGGAQPAELRYLAEGLGWSADYVAIVDSNDAKLDLDGLVTLNNQSGVSYPDAKLKLVAGDVRRVQEPRPAPRPMVELQEDRMMAKSMAAPPAFEESGLFEYHLYALDRPTTILDREQKQVSFLTARDAKTVKRFVFENEGPMWWWGGRGQDHQDGLKLAVVLEVENRKENALGMPLPKGKIRVYKQDKDRQLQFVGEDRIDHTPRDEKLRLHVGEAFDLRGQRVVEASEQRGESKTETIAVTIRNRKDEDVEVRVLEHQRFPSWRITQSTHPATMEDASTAAFAVKVPKRGEATVRYTYKASWK